MAHLAEFETAPAGTERRTTSTSTWISASVGDLLDDGHESGNKLGNAYQVRLYPEAGILFNAPTAVFLSNLSGPVKYKQPGGGWVWASDGAQYTAAAVGTGPGGSVSVVCSTQGVYKPKPWP